MEIKSAVQIIPDGLYERAICATNDPAVGINAALVRIHGAAVSLSSDKVLFQGESYSVSVGSRCSQPSKGDALVVIGGESILAMVRRSGEGARCFVNSMARSLLGGSWLPNPLVNFAELVMQPILQLDTALKTRNVYHATRPLQSYHTVNTFFTGIP